jgi:hypothetical protein
MPLYQIGPNRWTSRPPEQNRARSDLPLPHVISDTMPPTEQVDGRFYTSKRAFRAVGRSLGLTEVGTERPKPRKRYEDKAGRREALKTSLEKYRAGHRAEPT